MNLAEGLFTEACVENGYANLEIGCRYDVVGNIRRTIVFLIVEDYVQLGIYFGTSD